MSDREAFEKVYHKETGLYASWSPNNKGYTDVIAGMCYRIWQAAQAQATVNQQLLEALLEHFVGARFAIDTNMKGTAMDCINEGIAAIAAAQEQSNSRPAKGEK